MLVTVAVGQLGQVRTLAALVGSLGRATSADPRAARRRPEVVVEQASRRLQAAQPGGSDAGSVSVID